MNDDPAVTVYYSMLAKYFFARFLGWIFFSSTFVMSWNVEFGLLDWCCCCCRHCCYGCIMICTYAMYILVMPIAKLSPYQNMLAFKNGFCHFNVKFGIAFFVQNKKKTIFLLCPNFFSGFYEKCFRMLTPCLL